MFEYMNPFVALCPISVSTFPIGCYWTKQAMRGHRQDDVHKSHKTKTRLNSILGKNDEPKILNKNERNQWWTTTNTNVFTQKVGKRTIKQLNSCYYWHYIMIKTGTHALAHVCQYEAFAWAQCWMQLITGNYITAKHMHMSIKFSARVARICFGFARI